MPKRKGASLKHALLGALTPRHPPSSYTYAKTASLNIWQEVQALRSKAQGCKEVSGTYGVNP